MMLRYIGGVAAASVAFVPVALGSVSVRARRLPGWSGAPARLVEIVVGLTVVVGVSEALGIVGLYHLAPIVVALAGAGAALCYARRDRLPGPRAATGRSSQLVAPVAKGATLVALAATAIVVAAWSTRTMYSFSHGILDLESLRYHLPVAARFLQDGSIRSPHYVDFTAGGSLIPFYPDTAPLLHSLGMMFMGTDVLSPLVNSAFFAIALLAGWCVGRPYGVAPATLLGVLVVLASPQLVTSQPGSGVDDVVGIALILAAVAILVTADSMYRSRAFAPFAVAALAAGLALGVKWTFIPAVAALVVGLVAISPRGTRRRRAVQVVLLVALTGSWWYVRNLIAVGNPLPPVAFHLGPFSLPSVPTSTESFSLASPAFDSSVWSRWLHPGLRAAVGPAWWAILVLALVGLIASIVTVRSSMHRMLAFVGVATVVGYIVTPQPLAPGAHGAASFVWNVRYGFHGLIIGLVLLPLLPALSSKLAQWSVTAVYFVVLAVTQLDASIWPTHVLHVVYVEPVRGGAVRAGLAVGIVVFAVGLVLLVVRPRPHGLPRRFAAASVGVVALAVVVGGYSLQRYYANRRYASVGGVVGQVARTSHERTADAGDPWAYVMYGPHATNDVEYVGVKGPKGNWTPLPTCARWREALNAGHFTRVAFFPPYIDPHVGVEERWTRGDPAVTLLRRGNGESLYSINGPLDPDACP